MNPLELKIHKAPKSIVAATLTENPKVSVCVTAYDHEAFIEQCLLSILSQRVDFSFEVLIGEDDSNDRTREICIRLAKENPDKIRVFLHHRENVVSILGRKTGRFNFIFNLSEARGKYIALCDGDDYWTDPLKLQKQVDILEKNPQTAISAHNIQVLKDGELSAPQGNRPRGEWNTILDLAKANFIHTASCMFRNGLDIPDWLLTTSAADYPLHMLNAAQGDIHYSSDIMAVYRDHAGGIWSSLKREEVLKRWIHLLLTIYPHFNNEVKAVLNDQVKKLMGQLLKDTHMPLKQMDKKWLEEMIDSFDTSDKGLLNKKLADLIFSSNAMADRIDVSFISKRFKTSELIRAILKKTSS